MWPHWLLDSGMLAKALSAKQTIFGSLTMTVVPRLKVSVKSASSLHLLTAWFSSRAFATAPLVLKQALLEVAKLRSGLDCVLSQFRRPTMDLYSVSSSLVSSPLTCGFARFWLRSG